VTDTLANFLAAVLRGALPILLSALGAVFTQQAGVVNIGLEGIMLAGAFAAALCSFHLGNAALALAAALLAAALFAALFAVLCVIYHADEIIAGAGINILALGLTTTLARLLFTSAASASLAAGAAFPRFVLTVLALSLVPLSALFLYKTSWGLSLRACGAQSRAALASGIDVQKTRVLSTVFGGMLAGAGGALLSLEISGYFVEGMVSGRGFIALAAAAAGRLNPFAVLAVSCLFGAGLSLESRLQPLAPGIPYQIYLIIPYILTIGALCRRRWP
jgi:simple sugar transport system permease protein